MNACLRPDFRGKIIAAARTPIATRAADTTNPTPDGLPPLRGASLTNGAAELGAAEVGGLGATELLARVPAGSRAT